MVLEGDGWKVIDLGVNVAPDKFAEAVQENHASVMGMSALLTTTMVNMESTVGKVKNKAPNTRVFIGGAPLTSKFSDKIGADGYFPDPHSLVKYLARNIPAI